MSAEEAGIEELNAPAHEQKTRSNREWLRCDRKIDPVNIFWAGGNVKIGETQFDIKETENRRCDMQNWEIAVLFTEFLRCGWNPTGIDDQNIENMFLTVAELSGEYDSIPDLGEKSAFQLHSKPYYTPHMVEQPVTLAVGAEYPDKLRFRDQNTDEEHWLRINRVYLCDIWTEAMNSFNNPRYKEQLKPEDIEKVRAGFESHLSEICPKGMCFPVIEYECEEGITLQFYSKEWLDAAPVSHSSGIGILMKSDKKCGALGLPLKTAIIQEPMPGNTRRIEAELFLYNKVEKYADVIKFHTA